MIRELCIALLLLVAIFILGLVGYCMGLQDGLRRATIAHTYWHPLPSFQECP